MLRMVIFVFAAYLCKQACNVHLKNKNPHSGVFVLCLIVELAGVEPASRHGDHTLSTCLFLLDCRDPSGAEQPNETLFPVCFAVRSE